MKRFDPGDTELCTARAVYRAEGRTLLRAVVSVAVPRGFERIRQFYEELARAVTRWVGEVEGKRLAERFAALEGAGARSRFGIGTLAVTGGPVYADGGLLTMVCRSVYRSPDGAVREERQSAEVWRPEEETLLPANQIVRSDSGKKLRPAPGFGPDGCYRSGGEVVFFRNPAHGEPFAEFRVPLCAGRKPRKAKKTQRNA